MDASQLPTLRSGESLPPSDQWPKGLKKLLTEGEDGAGAIRLIALNDTLREQCAAMLPALQAAKAPAEESEVLKVLVRMAPVYALPSRPDEEWASFFGVYLDALEGFPAFAIEGAFLRWNRGEDMKDPAMGQFYPKPSQLVALATKAKAELWIAAGRAQKALERIERQAPRMTEEQRRENSAAIRALASKPLGRLPPQPPGVSLKDWAEQCRREGVERIPETPPAPKPSRHELAEQLRRAADGAEKRDIAPEDPGDVL